jgi:hypothetical protein
MLNSTESAQIIPGCEDGNQNIQGHAMLNENPDIKKLMEDNFYDSMTTRGVIKLRNE